MIRKLALAIVTLSHKFDSNPKSLCLSRIFRKQETNKGQLISRNRQENEPGPYATAEKRLRSNAASQYVARTNYSEIWPDFREF